MAIMRTAGRRLSRGSPIPVDNRRPQGPGADLAAGEVRADQRGEVSRSRPGAVVFALELPELLRENPAERFAGVRGEREVNSGEGDAPELRKAEATATPVA